METLFHCVGHVLLLGIIFFLRLKRREENKQWRHGSVALARELSSLRQKYEAVSRHVESNRKTAQQLQKVWECFCRLLRGTSGIWLYRLPENEQVEWKTLLERGEIEPMRHWLENAKDSPLFTGKP
jgi:hypothetical protein